MATANNESAWSTTVATNATADSTIASSDSQSPDTLDNDVRNIMASRARARLDQGGGLAAGGTANALTVTTNQVLSSGHVAAGQRLLIRATAANTSTTVTFAPDGLTAANIKRADGSALAVGSIANGMYLDLVYNGGSSEWRAANIPPIPVGASLGSALASFSAHKNGSAQTISTGVTTKVTFGTELWDTGSFFASNRWTPPAGTALLSAGLEILIVAGQTVAVMYLYKNGSAYQQVHTVAETSGPAYNVRGTWIAQCNGTDYFEIFFAHNDVGTVDLQGTSTFTYFSGSMI